MEKMSFWNKEQPLGLPKGSVRALLAIGTTATALYVVIASVTVPEWFYAAVGVIVAFYFVSKKE